MFKQLLACLVFFVTCGATVNLAQSELAPAASFIAVACETPIDSLYYEVGGKRLELKLPLYTTVGPQSSGAEKTLVFYKKEKLPGATAEVFKEVGKVDLPANSATNLLLFLLAADGVLHIKLFACDKDLFPPGHVRFINLAPTVAALKLNNVVVTIQPGESKVVPAVNSFVRYAVAMPVPDTNGWAESINGFGVVDDKTRVTVFVTDSKSGYFDQEIARGVLMGRTAVNAFQVRH